jgi:hypothetical protein
MANTFAQSREEYKKDLVKAIEQTTNIKIQGDATGLQTCKSLTQNDTVANCPLNLHKDKSEFLVAVHNVQVKENNQVVRILLPNANFKAQVWNKDKFDDVSADIFENKHFTLNGEATSDYIMFLQANMNPDEVKVIKL